MVMICHGTIRKESPTTQIQGYRLEILGQHFNAAIQLKPGS